MCRMTPSEVVDTAAADETAAAETAAAMRLNFVAARAETA